MLKDKSGIRINMQAVVWLLVANSFDWLCEWLVMFFVAYYSEQHTQLLEIWINLIDRLFDAIWWVFTDKFIFCFVVNVKS